MKLLQLSLLGAAMCVCRADWIVPTEASSESYEGAHDGSTLLRAKYDFNTAPTANYDFRSLIYVGEEAVVGCIETNMGREVAIARLAANGSDTARRLSFTGPAEETGTLFEVPTDYFPGESSGCVVTDSFIDIGQGLVEFVSTGEFGVPSTNGIPDFRRNRWAVLNITSGESHLIGLDNAMGEGTGLAAFDADDGQDYRVAHPKSNSHVSLMSGAVRCVGVQRVDNRLTSVNSSFFCWDTRLPAGQQVTEVAGVSFDAFAQTWAWADRYLVVFGWDANDDAELYWVDLQTPSASLSSSKLYDNPNGASFMPSRGASVLLLSDDVLCWLGDTGAIANNNARDSYMHCHILSQSTTRVVGEAYGSISTIIKAALSDGVLYFMGGNTNIIRAWDLSSGVLTKFEDVRTTCTGYSYFIYPLSDALGVVFSYQEQQRSNAEVAVRWKVGTTPVELDGLPLSANPRSQDTMGTMTDSGDVTPWSANYGTYLFKNLGKPNNPAVPVAVDRTTGTARFVEGTVTGNAAQANYVNVKKIAQVQYEGAGGAAANGILFYWNTDSSRTNFGGSWHEIYFWGGDPAVAPFPVLDPAASDRYASLANVPFFVVTDTSGAVPVSSLALTPQLFDDNGYQRLIAFRPALAIAAEARVPQEEKVYEPAAAFSDAGSIGGSQFTRSNDSALCMAYRNESGHHDFACIVEGPRRPDSAVRIELATAMPIHPLMTSTSSKLGKFLTGKELTETFQRVQRHRMGQGVGAILFGQEDGNGDEQIFYFDGHHAPVLVQHAQDPMALNDDKELAVAGDGRYVLFHVERDGDKGFPAVMDLGNDATVTFPDDGSVFGAERDSMLYSRVSVVYDRYFVDIMQTDGESNGADLVVWDTQNLAAGPQIYAGASTDIGNLVNDDAPPEMWHATPIMGGSTGELLFGIVHEEGDEDDDTIAATYFAGRVKAAQFDSNGALEDIIEFPYRFAGTSSEEWYQGEDGMGVESSTTAGEVGVLSVVAQGQQDWQQAPTDRASGDTLSVRLWNTRGLDEEIVSLGAVSELVRHAYVLNGSEVLLISFTDLDDEGQDELIRVDIANGGYQTRITCPSTSLPFLSGPKMNRVGNEGVCWVPAAAEYNEIDQHLVCYFKGRDACDIFDFASTESIDGSQPFGTIPVADPDDVTFAMVTLANEPRMLMEPVVMAVVPPVPVALPSPTPSTTASPTPSTSASPTPSTTASPTPSTTASPTPSTTASPTPSTSASPTPSTSSADTGGAVTQPSPSSTATNGTVGDLLTQDTTVEDDDSLGIGTVVGIAIGSAILSAIVTGMCCLFGMCSCGRTRSTKEKENEKDLGRAVDVGPQAKASTGQPAGAEAV